MTTYNHTVKDISGLTNLTPKYIRKSLKGLPEHFEGHYFKDASHNNAMMFSQDAVAIFSIIATQKKRGQSLPAIKEYLSNYRSTITTKKTKEGKGKEGVNSGVNDGKSMETVTTRISSNSEQKTPRYLEEITSLEQKINRLQHEKAEAEKNVLREKNRADVAERGLLLLLPPGVSQEEYLKEQQHLRNHAKQMQLHLFALSSELQRIEGRAYSSSRRNAVLQELATVTKTETIPEKGTSILDQPTHRRLLWPWIVAIMVLLTGITTALIIIRYSSFLAT